MLFGQLVSCLHWYSRFFFSVPDAWHSTYCCWTLGGFWKPSSAEYTKVLVNGTPASSHLLGTPASPSFGEYQSRSIPVSWLVHLAAPALNLLLQLSTLWKKWFFFFQNTGSTTMAAMWIEESCCWPAFRLLLLNSPTEEQLIKVSLDASIWGTYYCTGKIANNWRAMKTLSRTDRKKKRPTN